ncbi:hypothetical protein LPJ75_004686 [Coemansia sp. RSA 2598]|nr:hypothetical protein LPJ75_004686 [Coemansia sp. RSA 2598]
MELTSTIAKNEGPLAGSAVDGCVRNGAAQAHSSAPARMPRRPSSVLAGDSALGSLDRDIRKKSRSGNVRRRSSSSSSSSGASGYSSSNIVTKSETEKLPFDDILGKKARFYQENYECAFCDHEAETFGLMLKHIGSAHPWYDLSPHQNIK